MSIEKRIGFQADSDGFWTMCSTSASVALIFRVLLARSERKNLICVGFRPDDLKLYYRPVLQGFNNLRADAAAADPAKGGGSVAGVSLRCRLWCRKHRA